MSALPHLLSKAEFDLALSPDTSRVIARGERFSLHFSPHLLPTPEAVTKARHKALLRAASRTAAAGAASAPELCTDVHRLSHQPVDNFDANPESSHADKGLDASAGVPVPPCRTHGLTAAQREKIGQLLGPSPETLSVGVVVAKRFAKRAVMRNLIKRQVYALCELHRDALLAAGGRWVFRLKAPVDRAQFHSPSSEALKTAVRQEIEHLLKQGLKRYDKPSPPRPAGAPPRTGRGAQGAGGKPGSGKKPAAGGPRG